MPAQRHLSRVLVLLAAMLLLPHHDAVAQGSVVDRLRKVAQDEQKALVADANRQVNSAIQDAAAANVADGSFSAAFSPWSTSDGTKRVEIARYGGSAFAVTTAAGRQIVLCDDKGVLAWTATFTILDRVPAGAPGAGRAGPGTPSGGGRGTPGAAGPAGSSPTAGGRSGGDRSGSTPGAAAPGGRGSAGRGASGGPAGTGATGRGSGGPAPGSSAPAGRGGSSGSRGERGGASTAPDSAMAGGRGGPAASASAAPSADQREYRFPSPQVSLTLPATGPKTGSPVSGSIRVGDLSEDVFVGAAKIRFNQATIPGEKTPQVVDFGVAFKARVLPAGEQPAGCAVTNAGKPAVASARGAPASGRAAAEPPPAANAFTAPVGASAGFAEGDVLTPKIGSINLLSEAQDSAKVTAVLKKGDELVYLGEEKTGYIHVSTGTSEGWVRKVLVIKR